MDFLRIILKLTDRFYPTGRAFKIFIGGWKEAFYRALAMSEERAYIDSLGILNSILPDNALFSVLDAANWERRLGIFGNENSSLEVRKEAILRKMQHPGQAKARQHYLYIQGQLQKSGFDVYIHENTAGIDPTNIIGTVGKAVHALDVQHGNIQHGTDNLRLIVSSIDQGVDNVFEIGTGFNKIFFIGGEILGNFADVSADREIEFRNLILSLKPVQNVGVLLVNYI